MTNKRAGILAHINIEAWTCTFPPLFLCGFNIEPQIYLIKMYFSSICILSESIVYREADVCVCVGRLGQRERDLGHFSYLLPHTLVIYSPQLMCFRGRCNVFEILFLFHTYLICLLHFKLFYIYSYFRHVRVVLSISNFV